MGKKGAQRERELLMFDKLLLLLKRKDSKRYNYKGHIEVNWWREKGGSMYINVHVHCICMYRSWVQVPPEAAHFFFGKVTALRVLFCFALLFV